MSAILKKHRIEIYCPHGKISKCEIVKEDIPDRTIGWYKPEESGWIFWVVISDSSYKKAIKRAKVIYNMTISYLAQQNMVKMAEAKPNNEYYYSGHVANADKGLMLAWRLENPELSIDEQEGVLINETD